MTAQTCTTSLPTMPQHAFPTRAPLSGPRPITDAGRWGRRADELERAGSAVLAEAALTSHATTPGRATSFEPTDVDPSWQLLLRTSQALDLLLDLDPDVLLREAI